MTNKFQSDRINIEDKFFFANAIHAFCRALSDEGVDPAPLIQQSGITPEKLTREGPEISIQELLAFTKLASGSSQSPAIMLKAGLKMDITSNSILGYAMLCSRTIEDAIGIGEQYADIIGDVFLSSDIAVDNGKLINTLSIADEISHSFSEMSASLAGDIRKDYIGLIELYLAAEQTLYSDLMGKEFTFEEIHFDYEEPSYSSVYEEVFQCPLYFGSKECRAIFDEKLLTQELPHYNPLTLNTCLKVCEDFYNQQLNTRSLSSKIRKLMLDGETVLPSLEDVARQLNVSSRTLRRNLKNQGTNFQSILNNTRKELAIESLTISNKSVEQIATDLNFSDPSNFRSAFKRWTGTTPSKYRELYRVNQISDQAQP